MNEQLTPFPPSTQRRILALRRYMRAMEHGDAETIATVLQEAERDPALERLVLEINAVYQHEDHTVIEPGDVALVQQLLLNTISTEHTTGREEMSTPSLHDKDEPVLAVLNTAEQDESFRTNGHGSQQKQAGKKAATPVAPAKLLTAQRWYRRRGSWITAAVAAVLIVLLLLPGTGALASQFLSLFQVKQFQAVQVTNNDLSGHQMPSLNDLGTIHFQPNSFKWHNNLTRTQAAQMVNFPILLPTQLPQGITNNPRFGVVDSGHSTFTFSASKARAYLTKNGHGNVQVPANLDGATFDITTSAGVVMSYDSSNKAPFMIAEAPSPVIQATGKASLENLRDFTLSIPGLPADLVNQLKQININSGTFPLLVPSGVQSKAVQVHGTSGLLLYNDKTTSIENVKQLPAGRAVIWQIHGIIYAVGGVITDTNQLLATANSLQ